MFSYIKFCILVKIKEAFVVSKILDLILTKLT